MSMEQFQANDNVWFYGKDGKPIQGVVYLTSYNCCRVWTDCQHGNHYYEMDNQLLHKGFIPAEIIVDEANANV